MKHENWRYGGLCQLMPLSKKHICVTLCLSEDYREKWSAMNMNILRSGVDKRLFSNLYPDDQATQSTWASVQENHQLEPNAPRGHPSSTSRQVTIKLHAECQWGRLKKLPPPTVSPARHCHWRGVLIIRSSCSVIVILSLLRRSAGNHSTSPPASAASTSQDKTLTESDPKSASSMLSR